MKKYVLSAFILCALQSAALACSAAVISGAASVGGNPVLWKNRDTSHFNNGAVFVKEQPYSYIGITNEDDMSGRRVWSGLNSAGFAVINTVAYNLPLPSDQEKDLEGWVMGDVLRSCKNIADFEAYLRRNMGPAFGCQTNFGVIDAEGGAALFEVYNTSFTRFDANDAGGYLTVTNFSRSGTMNKGKGYIRFDRLGQLFSGVKGAKYSPEMILQNFSRDIANPMLGGKSFEKLYSSGQPYAHTVHTINRATTASAVVFEGAKKDQSPKDAIMWVTLGEPLCSVAVPLWVETETTPAEMQGGVKAPINVASMRLRSLLRHFADDEHNEYADLRVLHKWLEPLRAKERKIFDETAAFVKTSPNREQKAAFQNKMAARAVAILEEMAKKAAR